MKAKPILALSLLLNVGLAVVIGLLVQRPSTGNPAEKAVAGATPKTNTVAVMSEKPAPSAQPVAPKAGLKFDWRMVESADYRQYITNLRAIGCPKETIRDIITADVNKLYESRRKEITASTNKFEYWKTGNPLAGILDPDRMEKEQALNKEKRALLRELLGVEPEEKPNLLAGYNPFESMLDFLPTSKQNQIMDVYMKYQTKLAKTLNNGSPDAEDMKAMQQTQKDMENELAGMLTPEEFRQYQLRMSQTAMTMRFQLASFEPTKEEFDKIFDVRKQFDDQYGLYGMAAATPAERDKWRAAQEEMNTEIKTALGDTRYAEYQRSQDYDYQTMYRVVDKYDLPKDAAVKVYDMKNAAQTEAAKVRSDSSLTKEQRTTALQGIRTETEKAIHTVFGDKAWNSYKPGAYWLNGISPNSTGSTAPAVHTQVIVSP